MATDYTYGLNIAEDAFQRAGIEDSTVTDKMKRFVNRAYFDLLKMAEWPWALAHPPGIINTLAKVADTLTATEGSATATITTDSTVTSMAGRKIWSDVNQIPYRILTHTGTTITLDATWKEDSVSSVDCSIFQDEYDLAAACLRPWSFRGRNCQKPFRFSGAITHHAQWDYETYGDSIIDVSLIQHQKVRFKPWLTEAVTVEYLYCQQQNVLTFTGTSPGDVPVVPLWDRHVIADMALLLQLYDWVDQAPGYSAKITALTNQITGKIREMKSFYCAFEEGFSA
jgi:hypothetical protein